MTDANAYDLCYIKKVMENLICAPCRQAIWHTYCILIFGIYTVHIWMWDQHDIIICATWPCYMSHMWNATSLIQIWHTKMQMAVLHGSNMGNIIICHMLPCNLTHMAYSYSTQMWFMASPVLKILLCRFQWCLQIEEVSWGWAIFLWNMKVTVPDFLKANESSWRLSAVLTIRLLL